MKFKIQNEIHLFFETAPSVEHGPQQSPLMVKDLLLLSQMFYLPSEHGQYGLDLLNEFYWLKRNGTAMLPLGKKNPHSQCDTKGSSQGCLKK